MTKSDYFLRAAEAALLYGDGLSTLPDRLQDAYYGYFTPDDIFDHADGKEDFALSLCFMAAIEEHSSNAAHCDRSDK